MSGKKRSGPKTDLGHRDDVAEGIIEALRIVREMHHANIRHARESLALARQAAAALVGADTSFRRQREQELAAREQATADERRRGMRVA